MKGQPALWLLAIGAATVSIVLVLPYYFNGDSPWYIGITIPLSIFSIGIALFSFFTSQKEKRMDQAYHKNEIQKSIREAEAVFKNMSALSNDYDFMDEEEASQKIAAYAKRNVAKIKECRCEIQEHVKHLGSRDPASREIDGVVDALRWFDGFYGCKGPEPSVEQRVAWNENRDRIDGRLDRLSKTTKMLAGA